MENKQILIVDDEEHIIKALKRELLDFITEKELSIVSADSGLSGLKILEIKNKTIAVIISDQRMPEMTGSEFLTKVKELYPDIPSIILTGHTDIEDIIKLIKVGIFSFILKPWDKNNLLVEVSNALDMYALKVQNKEYLNRINNELQWAGELQKTLLHRELPKTEGIRFSITYLPLSELSCGGDYYDIITFSTSCFLVLIGDVAGHGVKAAFITAILKSIIYSGYVSKQESDKFSPADFLYWLNSRVCDELKKIPEMMITFSACCIDTEKKEVLYSNAGHMALIVIRNMKTIKVEVPGTALGITKNTQYTNYKFKINKDDKLILFSDGLIETDKNKNRNLPVDIEQLFLSHSNNANYNDAIIENILADCEDNTFLDDVTLISIDITR